MDQAGLYTAQGVDGCIVLHCPGHFVSGMQRIRVSVSDNVLHCGRGVIKVWLGSGVNKVTKNLSSNPF